MLHVQSADNPSIGYVLIKSPLFIHIVALVYILLSKLMRSARHAFTTCCRVCDAGVRQQRHGFPTLPALCHLTSFSLILTSSTTRR